MAVAFEEGYRDICWHVADTMVLSILSISEECSLMYAYYLWSVTISDPDS